MALLKRPVRLSKAENEPSPLQTRNMKANLPPNKQKEAYKYWIALSVQDHPREQKKTR